MLASEEIFQALRKIDLMRFSKLMIVVAAIGLMGAGKEGGEKVFSFRRGPARTGDLGKERLPRRPEVLWTFKNAKGFGGAVVADGVVYFGDRKGTLFALKADDGSVVWRNEVEGLDVSEAPVVVGDHVYFATNLGLTAFTRAGAAKWDYEIKGGAVESSPLAVDGLIIVAGYDGNVHAVEGESGKSRWVHDIAADRPPSPGEFDQKRAVVGDNAARPKTAASDGVTVFVPIFDQSRVVAIDLKTGKRRWSFQTKGWVGGEPTVAGDDLLITSQDQKLYCLDKGNGKERWNFGTKWRVESGVAVRDGSVYFGSCDGFIYRVDQKTGKEVWAFETTKGKDGNHYPIYSSPTVDDGIVCLGSFDGFLYGIETATGKKAWEVQAVEGAEVDSSPCFEGGRIFYSVREDRFNKTGANALIAIGDRK